MLDGDPLRSDPDDEQHRRLVAMIRGEDGRVVLVLTPEEIAGERVTRRVGMVGTVMVLAALYGVTIGVLWAHLAGVL